MSSHSDGNHVTVFMGACGGTDEQSWVIDNENRIRPLSHPEQCLEYDDNNHLHVCPCTSKTAQRWFWHEEFLINSAKECLSMTDSGELEIEQCSYRSTCWGKFKRSPDQKDVLNIGSLKLRQRTFTSDPAL